jgi:hypothetical protein
LLEDIRREFDIHWLVWVNWWKYLLILWQLPSLMTMIRLCFLMFMFDMWWFILNILYLLFFLLYMLAFLKLFLLGWGSWCLNFVGITHPWCYICCFFDNLFSIFGIIGQFVFLILFSYIELGGEFWFLTFFQHLKILCTVLNDIGWLIAKHFPSKIRQYLLESVWNRIFLEVLAGHG